MFPHNNPIDWEDRVPARVRRFTQAVLNPERKLLIAGSKGTMSWEDTLLLFTSLNNFGCRYFDLLIVNVFTECPERSVNYRLDITGRERIVTVTFQLCGELRGATFTDRGDKQEIREMFAQIPRQLEPYWWDIRPPDIEV